MNQEPILRTDGLTKRYGGVTAVDDVSFAIFPDETKALIGPNGAGKTSLLDCISGVSNVTAGEIYLREENVTGRTPEKMANAGVGRTYQITNLFDEFTVFENVRLAVQIANESNWNLFRHYQSYEEPIERAEEILNEVQLSAQADKAANTLAHGERRQLEIGLVLAMDPSLILLDEPTAGMASEGIESIENLISELGDDYPIILIEHNVELVMSLSDSIMVLDQGSLIANGPPDEVRTDERVREAYLGTDIEFLEENNT